MKNNTRILSFFLAVIMMVTFTVPAHAMTADFDLGQAWEVSDSGMTEEENPPTDDAEPTGDAPAQQDEPVNDPAEDEPQDAPTDEPLDEPASEPATPTATAGTLGMSGELSEAELLAAMEQWLNCLRLDSSGGFMGIMPTAAPGDTGTITHSTISIKPYDVTVPGVGRAYGSVIWRMKIKGEDAFCLQIWKLAGGTYTAGNATSGNGATAQYIANFMALPASSRTNEYYVATQVLVWESLYGNIGIYSQSIQGTNFEAAYNAMKSASAESSDLLYWTSSTGGQEIVTFATGTPPDDPEEPDDPGDEIPPTETITTTTTRTEVRGSTEELYCKGCLNHLLQQANGSSVAIWRGIARKEDINRIRRRNTASAGTSSTRVRW